ncbi:MAG: hypothetical protein GF313_00210 [Caldithrix sp.]|nr:hypothetical protein [Caldithrix sp.]
MASTVLLVLANDASIYFSMQYIERLPARIIFIMSGTISIVLNIKYMVDWRPPDICGLIIAVTVGLLIPLMLSLCGWLKKELEHNDPSMHHNGKLEQVIHFYLDSYLHKSSREIASLVGCSHSTV